MEYLKPQSEDDALDVTAVMVFTLSAIGLGGYPLFSLLEVLLF